MGFLDEVNESDVTLDPETPPPQPPRTVSRRHASRRRSADGFWDGLTVLLLVGMAGMLLYFFLIFQNPYAPFNPYPPDTPVPTLFIPTFTPTPRVLPPTWTPTATLEPTFTVTPSATVTETPTATFTPAPPTDTPQVSAYRYLMRGSPDYLPGKVIHPDEGCKLWVAGQAFDLKGAPVVGITVQIGGVLDRSLYLLTLTGTAPQYGTGGYEFVLAEQALASKESVWVQLLDQEGYALSPRVYFNTYADCEKNLILVNFKQVR